MKTGFLFLMLLLFAALFSASQQTRIITGKVSNESGQPFAGVSIMATVSKASAYSGKDGTYKISVAPEDKSLTFTFVGCVKHTEKIGDRKVINVTLKEEKLELEEMVVVGYGTAKDQRNRAMKMAAPSFISYASEPARPAMREDFNTEGYAGMEENGFRNVRSNPLSTFSIDVDQASYSNIRRFINNGTLPPADAVRIEEMINYFRYDYPEPAGVHPFSVYSELSACPWNDKHQLFMVGLKGKSVDKSSLPASNLVFLIDVSGSMDAPNKLPLLKSAFSLLVNELRPQDHIAIVVYAGAAGCVLPSTPGNKKEVIRDAINNLEAGGSTAGGAGLKLAYAIATENFVKGGNNRIILATDGDFNVGESSNGGMERLVEANRDRGVFITVLGFGMGNYKDDKMEIIADKGNGNYSYIDNLQEAQRVLVKEFGGTLFTIAKDVKFQIEFNPAKVGSYRLIGYENRLLNEEDFNDDKKDAGEMGSGHCVTALYELIPAGSEEKTPSVDPLKYQQRDTSPKTGNGFAGEYLNIKIRYKKPDGVTSMLFEQPVKDYVNDPEDASENLKFAAAVAEFGMILRNSEFKGNSTLESAIGLAGTARGNDPEGYRAEMVRLMKTAKGLCSQEGKDGEQE